MFFCLNANKKKTERKNATWKIEIHYLVDYLKHQTNIKIITEFFTMNKNYVNYKTASSYQPDKSHRKKFITNENERNFTFDRESFCNFLPVKSFRLDTNTNEKIPITSMNFHDSGEYLLSTHANKSIELYNARTCQYLTNIATKKYGCHSAIFTHSPIELIHASTSLESKDIRLLNLETNQYIRYFKGHGALVSDVILSPVDDTFISSSYDESVRVWDPRSNSSVASAILPVVAPNCIAYDPSGKVFGVGNPSTGEISLYDIKNLSKGCFLFKELDPSKIPLNSWKKLSFSNCGRYILLDGTHGSNFVLDAFTLETIFELNKIQPFPNREFADQGNSCFSPCGNYVISTSYDNKVLLWDISSSLSGRNLSPIRHIATPKEVSSRNILFNPKYSMFVTSDDTLDFFCYIDDK